MNKPSRVKPCVHVSKGWCNPAGISEGIRGVGVVVVVGVVIASTLGALGLLLRFVPQDVRLLRRACRLETSLIHVPKALPAFVVRILEACFPLHVRRSFLVALTVCGYMVHASRNVVHQTENRALRVLQQTQKPPRTYVVCMRYVPTYA